MWYVIIGVVFIIWGLSNHKGNGVGILFILLGIGNISFGIYRIVKSFSKNKLEEECSVINEKLIVYNKSHESSGVLTELSIGSCFFINRNNDFGRFYQIRIDDTQTGYILKDSKFSRIN
jgi:hypothetical protein